MRSKLIKKELSIIYRSIQLRIAGIIFIALMVTAVLVGKQGQQKIQLEREQAQASMFNEWLDQGQKHPHSAAHYGQFAFKPKPVLSFLDVGLDNYTGTSVFLEAHKKNEVLFSSAQDSNGMTRFGELTVALILQVLTPLLIIFLTFNTFSKEREEGTLKMISAQGISMSQLVLGKVVANFLVILMLFFPIILLSYFLLDHHSASIDSEISLKFAALLAGYAIYFLVFTILCVLISAFAKSSSFSLLSMLGIWIISCIILPKATANFADMAFPVPSQFEFKNEIKERVKKGIDGHNPSDERLSALKNEILAKYNVKTVEELPVNWGGIAMQAGEEYTDLVYDQEFQKIVNIYNRQNRISEWMGFLNPFLAIRSLSMALSGTDYTHHVAFSKAAENYRRAFVKKMNKDMEVNHKPNVAFSNYKVGPEMWKSVEPFSYQSPKTFDIISNQWRSITALCLWLIIFSSLSIKFSSKISIF